MGRSSVHSFVFAVFCLDARRRRCAIQCVFELSGSSVIFLDDFHISRFSYEVVYVFEVLINLIQPTLLSGATRNLLSDTFSSSARFGTTSMSVLNYGNPSIPKEQIGELNL